jgi:hypothetical protein
MKRRKKISKKRKILDKKFLIFSAGIIIIVLGFISYKVFFQNPEIKFSLKAAIIDQLGFGDTQNPEFNKTVTKILLDAGFNDVSYHKSETITVNFFQRLAKDNYGVIILRTHSALREDKSTVDLFTSENYTAPLATEYRARYGSGLLVKGEYFREPGKFYFAITSKFIESLKDPFPKSIVIAMGCWSLNRTQMADAFIQRGTKAYIGWTDMVYPWDTDNETVHLLNMLLKDDMQLWYAVSQTRNYTCSFGGQTVTTHLDFYPKSAGNLTISELIQEAKVSTTLQSTVNNLKPLPPLFCLTNVINYRSKNLPR